MTLNELDKNSKFGYRRQIWHNSRRDYTGFNGIEWRCINSKGTNSALLCTDAEADDWYLSDIPNKYHKRVAVITEPHGEEYWPVGTRIIKSNKWSKSFNTWRLADYSTECVEFHTIGDNCEWEDEIESEFPCPRKSRDSRPVVELTAPTTGTVFMGPSDWTLGDIDESWKHCTRANEETPKDATNSKHIVIVTKDDAYEDHFYADSLYEVKKIVAQASNELKKFHVFDYRTTLGQNPRKVITIER